MLVQHSLLADARHTASLGTSVFTCACTCASVHSAVDDAGGGGELTAPGGRGGDGRGGGGFGDAGGGGGRGGSGGDASPLLV